jgi:hypothetical protein
MLFFVSFIVSGGYLLFNLALVVAYSEFYTDMRGETLVRVSRQVRGADAAFDALYARAESGDHAAKPRAPWPSTCWAP